MKISVVIAAYNDEEYLPETLLSLVKQTYLKNFELIVVDNGSTDKTVRIAKRFRAKVVHEPIRGEVYAREKGFFSASGGIIATTDSDTIVKENWLSVIDNEFKKDPDLIAISGWLGSKDKKLFLRALVLIYNIFNIFQYKILDFSFFNATNLAVRKDVFLSLGGFRKNVLFPTEADFFERIKKLGEVKYVFPMQTFYDFRSFERYGFLKMILPYLHGWFSFNFLCGRFPPTIFHFTKSYRPKISDLPFKWLAMAKLTAIFGLLAVATIIPEATKNKNPALAVEKFKNDFAYQANILKSGMEPFFGDINFKNLKIDLPKITPVENLN